MIKKEPETFRPTSAQDWRQWLKKNHRSKQSVWLIYYKKKANLPTLTYSEAVDEALCFGWIDSTRKTIDDQQFMQLFTRRKPKSVWSKINKEKVERLIAEGRMTKAGMTSIETAKQNGSWTQMDSVEELKIPKDLAAAFKAEPGTKQFFLSLTKSVQKMMLSWVVMAKRPETRQKRIDEIVTHAAKKQKPKQFP